ncbi:hypothetical protein [Streptomyces sp. NRRL S-337]|uniref:hypothetical protein n=1 Tax=Streptomyces sp. NRRL S-337 TaxID=1463900 RepID=UPI0004CBAFDA|nr:hypothetical protein [Streptomyces sp. NRRL S-337]
MPSHSPSPRRRSVRVSLLAALATTVVTGSLVLAGQSGDPTTPAAATAPAAALAPAAPHAGQWQATPVPVKKGDLTAVAALSDKQAWAVGYRLKSATSLEAIALRWDGSSWTQESTLPDNSFPQALAVRSATDIWAVGSASAHWDGTKWTAYQLANDPSGHVVPDAVATTSDGKVWTVGRAMGRSIKDGVPAIQSWDGKAWHRQPLPDVGKGELSALTAVAPDDIWAAGAAYAPDEKSQQSALLLHFDGTSWRRVTAPGPHTTHNWLGAITALSADDIWAVGGSTTGSTERPLALHWNGSTWTTAKTPDVADGRLRAVGRTGNGDLWALGGKGAAPVALHWNDQRDQWEKTTAPDLVIRSSTTVPHSADLWATGISPHGDLIPAITRLKN